MARPRNGQVVLPRGPSVGLRTQQFAPVQQTAAPEVSGINALERSLTNFFGGQIAIDQRAQQNAHEIKLFEARQERAAVAEIERQQATEQRRLAREEAARLTRLQEESVKAKALLGTPMTEEEMANSDLVSTYQRVSGKEAGQRLANAYLAAVDQLPPGTDINAFREQFLEANLADGNGGIGTGVDIFDGYLLSEFHGKIGSAERSYQSKSFEAFVASAKTSKQAEIAAGISGRTAMDFARDVGDLRELDPTSAHEAVARVAGMYIDAAGDDPRKIAAVQRILEDPVSGDGERSFAELFPTQAAEMFDKGVEAYRRNQTIEGYAAMRAIEDSVRQATTLEELGQAAVALEEAVDTYGEQSLYPSIRGSLTSKLNTMAEEFAELNQVKEMMWGQRPLDASLMGKNFLKIIQESGIDPRQNPQQVAQLAHKARGQVGQDFKAQLTADLANPSNTEAFTSAYQLLSFYAELNGGNTEYALDLVAASVHHDFQIANRMLQQGTDLETIATTLRDRRANESTARDVPWSQFGIKETDALQTIQSRAEDILGVRLTPGMADRMAREARIELVRRGGGDHRNAIDDVLRSASISMTPIPTSDGTLKASPITMPEGTVRFGDNVPNPDTGNTENTARTFRRDMDGLLGWMREDDTDHFSVAYEPALAREGYYSVVGPDGRPVVFAPGQEVTLNGKTHTIPTNPAELETFLQTVDLTPERDERADRRGGPSAVAGRDRETSVSDRVVFMERNGVYVLGYRPGFVNRLPTVEELANR